MEFTILGIKLYASPHGGISGLLRTERGELVVTTERRSVYACPIQAGNRFARLVTGLAFRLLCMASWEAGIHDEIATARWRREAAAGN